MAALEPTPTSSVVWAPQTFRIYTRAEALLAGIDNAIAGNTEIVITRNGTNNASIIAHTRQHRGDQGQHAGDDG